MIKAPWTYKQIKNGLSYKIIKRTYEYHTCYQSLLTITQLKQYTHVTMEEKNFLRLQILLVEILICGLNRGFLAKIR